uniref:Putative secreted protein n=1 Tax=Ixodes ricinus TaxID=34613 RepID=A0A6B0UPC7_IXORI
MRSVVFSAACMASMMRSSSSECSFSSSSSSCSCRLSRAALKPSNASWIWALAVSRWVWSSCSPSLMRSTESSQARTWERPSAALASSSVRWPGPASDALSQRWSGCLWSPSVHSLQMGTWQVWQ